MLRKILLGVAAIGTLSAQPSYAGAGADVAAPMRWAAAAYATNPADRCPNVYGAQYWFFEYPPNCVSPQAGQALR